MRNEKKQEFTYRISHANKSEMIVILYDMFDEYTKDAMANEGTGDYHKNIQHSLAVLRELIASVKVNTELGANLYSIYRFVEKQLIKADVALDASLVEWSRGIINKLRDAFAEVARLDTSQSIMIGAQEVVVGMTYGRGSLNALTNSYGRGFMA